jgi:transcriptional antiterminator RfaH
MTVLWYVMQSKPNKEDALHKQLLMREIEVFYPRILVNPVNPRSRKVKAYFPGYLFVHVDLSITGSSTLQWMPFARGMVSFDNEPAMVPDNLLQAIRNRIGEVNAAGGQVFDGLKKGDMIYIQDGPFEGYEAIFDVRLPGSERVRVLIEWLNRRQVPVELRTGEIRQLKPHESQSH